jgi:hypothetical protein
MLMFCSIEGRERRKGEIENGEMRPSQRRDPCGGASTKQLDLETLVATRGPNFPISRLESRLMCPSCGNRQVTVVFEPPSKMGGE